MRGAFLLLEEMFPRKRYRASHFLERERERERERSFIENKIQEDLHVPLGERERGELSHMLREKIQGIVHFYFYHFL